METKSNQRKQYGLSAYVLKVEQQTAAVGATCDTCEKQRARVANHLSTEIPLYHGNCMVQKNGLNIWLIDVSVGGGQESGV